MDHKVGSISLVGILAALLACLPGAFGQAQDKLSESRVVQAVAQLDSFAKDGLSRTKVPGMAIAVVFQDRVFFLNYGVRKAGEPAPITSDTVFQLASVSKPLTSTTIARLVSQQYVHWDDPIALIDPDFKLSDPLSTTEVTIRDLLSHRSGLPDFAGDLLDDLGYSREEILQRLRYLPVVSLRSEYHYTNFGITEAAHAVAREYGEKWEDLIARHLFVPLGMTSSSARYSEFVRQPNRATIHVPGPDGMVAKYERNPDAYAPAAGVSSSASDLARWLRMHLNQGNVDGFEFIQAPVLQETYRPHALTAYDAPNGDASFYGLGWDVSIDAGGRRRISHSGAFSRGAATNVSFYPEDKVGIVVLTNAFPVGLAEAMAATFLDLLYNDPSTVEKRNRIVLYQAAFAQLVQQLLGSVVDFRDLSRPEQPTAPSLPATGITGTYTSPYYGTMQVTYDGQSYSMSLGAKQSQYPLNHWDGDLFTYFFDAESGTGLRGVQFQAPVDGHFTQVVVHNLMSEAEGRFTFVNTTPRAAARN